MRDEADGAVFPFDEQRLVGALAVLPGPHRLAFMAACCERLLPNYVAFQRAEGWGDAAIPRRALDSVWGYLGGDVLTEAEIGRLIDACDQVVPPSDGFWSLFRPLAEDAATGIILTLEYQRTGDLKLLGQVGRLPVDSIDMYLSIVGRPNPTGAIDDETREDLASLPLGEMTARLRAEGQVLDRWVWGSPLMEAELAKQRRDLADLCATPVLTAAFLARLRQSSRVVGIQPLDRGLVPEPKPEPDGGTPRNR